MTGPDDRMTRHPSSVNGPDDRMTPSKRVIRPVLVGKGDPNLGVTPFSPNTRLHRPKDRSSRTASPQSPDLAQDGSPVRSSGSQAHERRRMRAWSGFGKSRRDWFTIDSTIVKLC